MNIHTGSKYIIGFVSFPNYEIAKSLARKLVSNKLVACAKIINNIDSFYIYDGRFEEDKEVYMIVKTRMDKVEDVKQLFDNEHPYKVYEFIYQEAQVANHKYALWIDSLVGDIKYDI